MIDDINGQFLRRLSPDFGALSAVSSLSSFALDRQADSKAPYESSCNLSCSSCMCSVSGSQQEARVTPNAKTDMQRHGKKYGNLPNNDSLEKRYGYFSAG